MTTTVNKPEEAHVRLRIAVLKDLAGQQYPREALGVTAGRFNLTVSRVRELVEKHGFPAASAMLRSAGVLEQRLAAAATAEAAEQPVAEVAQGIGQEIDIDKLIDHPNNPAERIADVTELAASILESGVIQPLLVTPHREKPGYFLVLGGHRRKHAARRAGRTTVPCTVKLEVDDLTDERVLMLVENVQRKDLNAMQKAEAFGELRDDRGLTQAEICRRTGLSVGTVAYYLSLLDLDAGSRERVRTGEVQVVQAVTAVRNVRRTTRKSKGHGQSGRPVIVEAAHFTDRHPLARRVRELCTHTNRPSVGQVGCGQCWEQAIRDDAQIPEGTWS
jgi:ParB family chromosome partitioning protein